jgi:fructosamine-3-kinase
MLNAEYEGIKEIYDTQTIRVPKPICCGTYDYSSYAVFERLNLGGSGDPKVKAEKLVAMHRCTSPNGLFGWKMNNTCGLTFQPNNFESSWSEFFVQHRLKHMLNLAKRDGAYFPTEDIVIEKVRNVLDAHICVPSLVHGDLWAGNHGYTKDGEPCIYDPSTYVSTKGIMS